MDQKKDYLDVLLVEDNQGDIVLTKAAFAQSNIKSVLSVAKNGEEGLNFLFKKEGYENAPTPDLILLDLNLPKKNGLEVLKVIKNHELLKTIPVIILSTSKADQDVMKSYELNANCYITKPIDFTEFSQVVNDIADLWFNIIELPRK